MVRHDSDCFVVGTLADVTLAHQEQELSRQRSAIFEAVYNCESIGVAVLDARLRLLRANGQLARLAGREAEAMKGLSLAEICPEALKPSRALLAGPLPNGPLQPHGPLLRTALITENDERRDVELELVALPGGSGEAALLLVLQALEGPPQGPPAGAGSA